MCPSGAAAVGAGVRRAHPCGGPGVDVWDGEQPGATFARDHGGWGGRDGVSVELRLDYHAPPDGEPLPASAPDALFAALRAVLSVVYSGPAAVGAIPVTTATRLTAAVCTDRYVLALQDRDELVVAPALVPAAGPSPAGSTDGRAACGGRVRAKPRRWGDSGLATSRRWRAGKEETFQTMAACFFRSPLRREPGAGEEPLRDDGGCRRGGYLE